MIFMVKIPINKKMKKMFDPNTTKGKWLVNLKCWNEIHVKENCYHCNSKNISRKKCKCLEDFEENYIEIINAIPELLEVYKAAKLVLKASSDCNLDEEQEVDLGAACIEHLFDCIKNLEERHFD